MSEVAAEYIELDRRVKMLTEQLDDAKKARDRKEFQVLAEMARTNTTSYKTPEATSFLKRNLRVSLLAEVPRAVVRKAFQDANILELLKEQCNANQLSAYIRGEVEAGRAISPALLSVLSIFEDFSVEVRKRS